MTAEIMVNWLQKILDRRSGALLAKLNAFKSHLTEKVKTSNLNAHIVITTEGMTSR
jgi:hypothetical protein